MICFISGKPLVASVNPLVTLGVAMRRVLGTVLVLGLVTTPSPWLPGLVTTPYPWNPTKTIVDRVIISVTVILHSPRAATALLTEVRETGYTSIPSKIYS